uniref:Si:ch73-127m5.3 n=1 Tax=Amphiprion percula TaxID=161767 RepID=A0A3P8SZM9_AMPPE
MRTSGVLVFFCATLSVAQKQKTSQRSEWDYRNEAEKVNTRGCANLTLVLDNWKYAIMTQVKDLLLHDHSTVLPDYGRSGSPLSDALGDLYKEFNTLKERLAELTTKFDGVEAFVDDVRLGRNPAPVRGEPRPPGPPAPREVEAPDAGGRPQGRRSRVVVRRIKKPANPQD